MAIFAGLLVFALVWLLRTLPLVEWLDWLKHHAHALGPIALVVTALLFAVGCIFFLPTTLVVAAAGATFGIGMGLLSIWLGYGLAVAIVWVIGGRFSEPLKRKFEAVNPHADSILQALAKRGPWLVFLTQLHPLFPAALLNYLYPSLGLNWRSAIPAIMLGRVPTLAMYVALGAWSAKGLSTDQAELAWVWWVSIGAAFLLCAILGRMVTKAIHEAIRRDEALE